MKYLKLLIVLAAALGASPSLSQDRYVIENGTFWDGATFSGFFDYDSAVQQIGLYSITTLPGIRSGWSEHAGYTYTSENSTAYLNRYGSTNSVSFDSDATTDMLFLDFENALSGEPQNFETGQAFECYALCANNYRAVTAGSVSVIAAAPEPSAWAMMIFGFGLVGVALRRDRARQFILAPTT